MNDFATRRSWGPKPNYPTVAAVPKQDWPLIVIAGPCSVESHEQIDVIVPVLRSVGATYCRGGLFRAGTYPPPQGVFGLKRDLMEHWAQAVRQAGLKTIIEVLDIRQLDDLWPYADAFQVGARQMQNYSLLDELSKSSKVVTLKRNMGATLDEWLGAAEYLARGSAKPILVERGGSSFLNHTRWELSVSIIPAAKSITGLPVLCDSSHGSGRRDLVEPLTLAAIAAGADGFIIEVHPDPEKSLSDADQATPLERLQTIVERAAVLHTLTKKWRTS